MPNCAISTKTTLCIHIYDELQIFVYFISLQFLYLVRISYSFCLLLFYDFQCYHRSLGMFQLFLGRYSLMQKLPDWVIGTLFCQLCLFSVCCMVLICTAFPLAFTWNLLHTFVKFTLIQRCCSNNFVINPPVNVL